MESKKTYAFPERLLGLMKKHKVSQEKLGDVLGSKRQTVSLYTTGKSKPDIETLYKISDFFGVSGDYLLGITDTESPDADVQAIVKFTGLSQSAVEKLSGCAKHKGGFFCMSFLDGENIPFAKEYLRILSWLITSKGFWGDGILDDLVHMEQADSDAVGFESWVVEHNPGLRDAETSITLKGGAMGDYYRRNVLDDFSELVNEFRKQAGDRNKGGE